MACGPTMQAAPATAELFKNVRREVFMYLISLRLARRFRKGFYIVLHCAKQRS